MNFEIEIECTPKYFEDFYFESLKFLKLRKWLPLLSSLLFLGGIILAVFTPSHLWFIPLFFIIAGVYEIYNVFTHRKKWIAARLKSNILNKKNRFIFSPQNIQSIGPFNKGVIVWESIQKIKVSENAIFISPLKGMSIYLPKSVFDNNEQIDFIIKKIGNPIYA